MRDESRILIGRLSKKGSNIYDSDISENESILDTWGKYLTLGLNS